MPFSCTCNGHQKSNCLLISSKVDVVKSLWNCLQSVVPDRIENGEKPCISKDFLALCFTSQCHIGSTPKRKVARSNRAGRARLSTVFVCEPVPVGCKDGVTCIHTQAIAKRGPFPAAIPEIQHPYGCEKTASFRCRLFFFTGTLRKITVTVPILLAIFSDPYKLTIGEFLPGR